jgi:uncharacterized protein
VRSGGEASAGSDRAPLLACPPPMSGRELEINVGDLDAGGKRYSFPLRAAWIRGVLEDHEATATGRDGTLDVRASRSGNDVVIHGSLKAELEVPCARCLAPVPLSIDETLSLLFVPGKVAPPPVAGGPESSENKRKATDKRDARDVKRARKKADVEEYELSAEDADTLPYEGEVIVLDDVVRDELILETPIFPLCSEDCPGMSAAVTGLTGVSTPLGVSSDSRSPSPREGEDADIDPRLRPLLRLRGKREA